LNGEQALDFPILENQLKIENYPELPKHDVNTAKASIKKALDKNKNLKESGLNIATVRSGYLPEITEKLAEEIRSLGLNANVTVYEPGQDFMLNTLSQRNYDILVYEIGLGPDPDVFAYYHSTEANANGHNLSNYKNVIVSDLVLSARSTMGINLRTKKYEKFLEYFNEDVPAIGLYQSNMTYFVNKNISAFSGENRLVTATDHLLDVEQWGIKKTTKNRTP
jgi:peptide/nickel transport system substrate-binding protein